jgi:hypothetical protein
VQPHRLTNHPPETSQGSARRAAGAPGLQPATPPPSATPSLRCGVAGPRPWCPVSAPPAPTGSPRRSGSSHLTCTAGCVQFTHTQAGGTRADGVRKSAAQRARRHREAQTICRRCQIMAAYLASRTTNPQLGAGVSGGEVFLEKESTADAPAPSKPVGAPLPIGNRHSGSPTAGQHGACIGESRCMARPVWSSPAHGPGHANVV